METIVWKEIKVTSINSAANYHENQFFQEDHLKHLYLPKKTVINNKSADKQVHMMKVSNKQKSFFRSFVSLFKYCDLCNGASHQFIFKQVFCEAFSITYMTACWLLV